MLNRINRANLASVKRNREVLSERFSRKFVAQQILASECCGMKKLKSFSCIVYIQRVNTDLVTYARRADFLPENIPKLIRRKQIT